MTQHASSSLPPTAPEPSHAERTRTLLETESVGTLATQSVRHAGWPFASVMPYALTADGSPLFLVSSMAVHTQNLVADPRASLLVMQSGGGSDPLGSPRATLLGKALPTSGAAKDLYLPRHPSARHRTGFVAYCCRSCQNARMSIASTDEPLPTRRCYGASWAWNGFGEIAPRGRASSLKITPSMVRHFRC